MFGSLKTPHSIWQIHRVCTMIWIRARHNFTNSTNLVNLWDDLAMFHSLTEFAFSFRTSLTFINALCISDVSRWTPAAVILASSKVCRCSVDIHASICVDESRNAPQVSIKGTVSNWFFLLVLNISNYNLFISSYDSYLVPSSSNIKVFVMYTDCKY